MEIIILNGTKTGSPTVEHQSCILSSAQSAPDKVITVSTPFWLRRPGRVVSAKEINYWVSDTHTIMYNDVRVPVQNRIGEDGMVQDSPLR